jgi:transposase-like protein
MPHINRAENSHLVIRRLERKQQNFKSHAAALAIAPFP